MINQVSVMRIEIALESEATEVRLYDQDKLISTATLMPAGLAICEAFTKYVRLNHHFLIGILSAERMIYMIGCATSPDEVLEAHVKGRNMQTGLPAELILNSSHVYEAIHPMLDVIASKVASQVKHEIDLNDCEKEISLVGSYKMIKGLDTLIESEINKLGMDMVVKAQ